MSLRVCIAKSASRRGLCFSCCCHPNEGQTKGCKFCRLIDTREASAALLCVVYGLIRLMLHRFLNRKSVGLDQSATCAETIPERTSADARSSTAETLRTADSGIAPEAQLLPGGALHPRRVEPHLFK